jgi:hypothetical protein
VDHPVAGFDPQALDGAAVEFQHRAHHAARFDRRLVHRHGALVDMRDKPGLVGEQHVERDQRIAHPHRDGRIPLEVEQHARIGRHLAAIHQAQRAALIVIRELDREFMNLTAADDFQRPLLEGDARGVLGEGRRRDERGKPGEEHTALDHHGGDSYHAARALPKRARISARIGPSRGSSAKLVNQCSGRA